MPTLHVLQLENFPIWDQLKLEEALVRTDHRNWCVVNSGSPQAIVMGISNVPAQMIDLERLQQSPIPVIKRFSGGGTVAVDEDTLFVSFICQHGAASIEPYPEAIMRWSSQFYTPLLPDFALRENDYVIGSRKFGGNAQYLRKNCWLHHSTLLWDFRDKSMDYLTLPSRKPLYRESRGHADFLCRLKDYLGCRQKFLDLLLEQISTQFELKVVSYEEVEAVLARPHRQVTAIQTV